jgi:hypothetical protein
VALAVTYAIVSTRRTTPAFHHHSIWGVEGLDSQVRVWLGLKRPIACFAEISGPSTGFGNAWYVITTARFQQKHIDCTVFSQPTNYDRAGCSRTADDDVVSPIQVSGQAQLVITQPPVNVLVEGRVSWRQLLPPLWLLVQWPALCPPSMWRISPVTKDAFSR